MEIIGNTTSQTSITRNGNQIVGNHTSGFSKLTMFVIAGGLVFGGPIGCSSGNTFNNGLNDFGKSGGQLGEAGGKAASGVSNLFTGEFSDSGADLMNSVGNVGGAVIYGVSGATKLIIGTGKGIYKETIQSDK